MCIRDRVINTDEFRRVIAKALLMTDQSKAIVTIGIKPCRPETGYGYIAAGEEVDQDIRDVYKRQKYYKIKYRTL